jgi:two-component system, NtrC family, sensor kinase
LSGAAACWIVHALLRAQLLEHFGTERPEGEALVRFLAAVDAAYAARDTMETQLGRALDSVSHEVFAQSERQRRDIEAIQQLEVELRQAEKLRAVGQLASGVAHEINTPMQFVGDNVHFLKGACGDLLQLGIHLMVLCDQIEGGEDPRPIVAGARKLAEQMDINYLLEELPNAFSRASEGVSRVVEIVTAMKDLGRSDSRSMVLADLNRGLSSTLVVARGEIKHVADLEVELGEVPLVPCHVGELNQVFLNLVVNAAHAVGSRFSGSGEKGKIRISTGVEGEYVVVKVADNGCGIPDDKKARIFEPFFTTKPVGQGTGQGLAIARSIVVDKHRGSMTFESKAGEGTSFFVKIRSSLKDHAPHPLRGRRATHSGRAPAEPPGQA